MVGPSGTKGAGSLVGWNPGGRPGVRGTTGGPKGTKGVGPGVAWKRDGGGMTGPKIVRWYDK